jgi:hypothetical protein
MSSLADQLLALAKHTGAPDVVEDAAILIRSLEGVRAERAVLQEIVDEQRAQIAKLVERIVELTQNVASMTDERRHDFVALSGQVKMARIERDRARRLVCELQCDPPERFIGVPHEVAQMYGWDCFPEATP